MSESDRQSPGSEEKTSTSTPLTTKVFVGGIPWSTTDAAFTSFFSRFGEIKDSVIIRDKVTRASRGFGFVKFAEPSSVDKVLAAGEELVLDGRKLECKIAIPQEQMQSGGGQRTKKLFIGGLSALTTEQQFREHFAQFGTIVDAVVMVDKQTGRSRGFGFVTYDSEDAADNVLARAHTLNGKLAEVKRAVPKEDIDDRRGGSSRRGYDSYGDYYSGGGGGYYADDYYGSSYGPSYRGSRGGGRDYYQDDYAPTRSRGGGYSGSGGYGSSYGGSSGGYGSSGSYSGGYGSSSYSGAYESAGASRGRDSRAYHPYSR